MKTFCKVFFSVIGILIAVLALAWIGLNVAGFIIYEDYNAEKSVVCEIPGLDDGFVPQGIAYSESEDAYFHSGYWEEDIALFYVKGEDVRRLIVLDETGEIAAGHGGGVAVFGEYLYIADSESLLLYRLSDLVAAKDGDRVNCISRLPVDNAASFCFADDENGRLYVGEFYRAVDYETDMAHAFTTPEGEENRAIVSCYQILEDGTIEEIPEYWISLPSQVQGFAIHNGVIALSRSWGLNSSSLEFYNGMIDSGKTAHYADKEVKIYYVGSANVNKKLDLPAFSEDLDVREGKVIVSFESACNKYIVGKLFYAYHAEAYPIPLPQTNEPVPHAE